jgi:hypothetical protein
MVIRPNTEMNLYLLPTAINPSPGKGDPLLTPYASFYNWSVIKGGNEWTLN